MHRRAVLKTLTGAALAAPLAGTVLRSAPAAAATTTAAATTPSDPFTTLLDAEHAAGMPSTFALIREGGQTYLPAAGVSRPDLSDYEHRVGGITKSFTAATVLSLVGEGLIDLDAPIARYLPGLLTDGRGGQITVRMLLNHTSGIQDFMVINLADGSAPPPAGVLFTTLDGIADSATRTYSPHDLLRIGLSLPPLGPPGSVWSYASTNYVILGLLIEKTTGRGYEEEVTRRVLGPLDLRGSYLPGGRRRLRGPHLPAYVPWTGGALRDFATYDMSWAWASCDLVSTARDLNTFYSALLGGRLLPSALLNEMKTTVPMAPAFPQYAGYGLGIFWTIGPCGPTWGHDGLVVGHCAYSLHAEDGASLQVTQMENLNFYESAAQRRQGVNPIDAARSAFQGAALAGACAPAAAVSAASANTMTAANTASIGNTESVGNAESAADTMSAPAHPRTLMALRR